MSTPELTDFMTDKERVRDGRPYEEWSTLVFHKDYVQEFKPETNEFKI